MKRSKFSDEQILAIVKEGEAGRKLADLCRTYGITEQTYYRWKAKYGGMDLIRIGGRLNYVDRRPLTFQGESVRALRDGGPEHRAGRSKRGGPGRRHQP
jgi:putative transposase